MSETSAKTLKEAVDNGIVIALSNREEISESIIEHVCEFLRRQVAKAKYQLEMSGVSPEAMIIINEMAEDMGVRKRRHE